MMVDMPPVWRSRAGLKINFFPKCPAAVLNSTVSYPRLYNRCPKLVLFFILKLLLIKPILKTKYSTMDYKQSDTAQLLLFILHTLDDMYRQ